MARSTDEWEQRIGEQVRAERIRAGVDQATLASRANVSVSSLSALENGEGSRLATLVRVVRALGREQWLDDLTPAASVSPLAMLRDRDRPSPRKRVTKAVRATGASSTMASAAATTGEGGRLS